MSLFARSLDNGATITLLELDPATYQAWVTVNSPKAALHRPYVQDPMPTPSATQIVQPGPIAWEATQARATWVLQDKPQAVLDAEADAAERDQLKGAAVLDKLKAEAAGNSTLTAAQFRVLAARCLIWLIKRA